jgi:hypothetical protein
LLDTRERVAALAVVARPTTKIKANNQARIVGLYFMTYLLIILDLKLFVLLSTIYESYRKFWGLYVLSEFRWWSRAIQDG